MSDMVERVARAIHAEYNRRYLPVEWSNDPSHWLAFARAAIEAMRSPMLAVIDARAALYETKAEKRDPLADDDRNGHDAAKDHAMAMGYLRAEITAMIDQALSESKL